MRKLILAPVLATLALGGSAVARDRSTPPAAEPVGQPVDCVHLTDIRSTRVYGDSTIDFHLSGNRVYRNTLPDRCPTLGFEERFLYRTSLSQLCSVDMITVLRSPGLSSGPSCGLGKFQPVKLSTPAKG